MGGTTVSRTLTRTDANQTLRITPERHRAISHLAIDRDATLIQIADEVVKAGIEAIREREARGNAPSAN